MTSTAVRPAADQASASRPAAGLPRLLVSGAAVAAWVVAAGLGVVAAPVLLAWVAAGAAEPMPDALSVAAAGWLLGLGATLASPDASWGLTPLGLTLVCVLLAVRGGSWAAETATVAGGTRSAVLLLAAGMTAAALAGASAAALTLEEVMVDPGQAATQAALVTLTGTGIGLVKARPGGWRALLGELAPRWLRRALVGSLAALAVLTAAGAAIVSVALVSSFDTTSTLLQQIDPGPAGGLALLLGSLAYLPTVIVWAVAVLAGPGVAIGGAVTVRADGVDAGALPGFPLLGIVPVTMPVAVPVLGVLTLVTAGTLAGLLVARRRAPNEGPLAVALGGLVAGAVSAAVVGVACWAATGPMGPGLLAEVGPTAPAVAGVVGAVVGVIATATAWLAARRAAASGPQA